MKVKVIAEEGDWICGRLGKLLTKLPYVETGSQVTADDSLVYYIPYLFYNKISPRGRKTCGFFTHFLPGRHQERFLKIASEMYHCVVMADQYANFLADKIGANRVTKIKVPVDSGFRPRKLKLGWYNRIYFDKRKRETWIGRLRRECGSWIEIQISNGKYTLDQVQQNMREQDAVLVTAKYEGGPMCLLEALASGVDCVIGETVGFAKEFANCPGVITYDAASYDDMVSKLSMLYKRRTAKVKEVSEYNEGNWIDGHDELFKRLASVEKYLL